MTSFTLQPIDGEQTIANNKSIDLYHDVSLRANGENQAGTVTLTGKKPGSDVFEDIPDGVFDLSNLKSIMFTGCVAEYKITISGISGVTSLYLTDTSQRA